MDAATLRHQILGVTSNEAIQNNIAERPRLHMDTAIPGAKWPPPTAKSPQRGANAAAIPGLATRPAWRDRTNGSEKAEKLTLRPAGLSRSPTQMTVTVLHDQISGMSASIRPDDASR